MSEMDDRPTVAPVAGKWARLRNGITVGPIELWDEDLYPFCFGTYAWIETGHFIANKQPSRWDIIEILDAPDQAPAAPANAALDERRPTGSVEIAHDGFAGDIIGHYTTREGKRGVVVQQHGTRVVHVYGEKWIVGTAENSGGAS